MLINPSIQPQKSTAHQIRPGLSKNFYFLKLNTDKAFGTAQLIFSTSYYKKYGIMCCIVLKFYYLCVVIGDKPVKSCHKVLKV